MGVTRPAASDEAASLSDGAGGVEWMVIAGDAIKVFGNGEHPGRVFHVPQGPGHGGSAGKPVIFLHPSFDVLQSPF
jgi:hypothetical protein